MNKKTKNSKLDGFTLIEMLVVIAIIAILAGIIFPTIGKAIRTAKRNRAAAEATSVAAAVQMFHKEYGYMPSTAAQSALGSDSALLDSKEVVDILMGNSSITNANGDPVNPKGILYLDSDRPISAGEFLDPWGNQYLILLDLNFDNKLTLSGNNYTKRAIVISRGVDGQRDPAGGGDDVANVSLE